MENYDLRNEKEFEWDITACEKHQRNQREGVSLRSKKKPGCFHEGQPG